MRAESASEAEQGGPGRQAAISQASTAGNDRPGLPLMRIRGVEVRLDWSLILIFALIVVNLGAGLFPRQHPGWGPLLAWTTAILAAVLFFASVLAHELAHAIVGRRHGVPIDRITLFVFGGMAEMKAEPPSPKAEFLMAIVGPLTSFAIGVLALLLGYALVEVPSVDGGTGAFMRALSAPATLLFWLGPLNIILGIFNLLPGFPLDGGRVLRAILWRATGDLQRATRWATGVGRFVAFALMFLGVLMIFGRTVPVLGGGLAQGLWLLLIGWFLNAAAMTSYHQVVMRRLFEGIPVSRLMRPATRPIDVTASVQQAADRFLADASDRCLPVVDRDRFVGLVCLSDLARVPRSEWPLRLVGKVMTPMSTLSTTTPSEDVAEALAKLARQDVDQLPVVENGDVRGFLRRADVLRWLELQRAGT